MRERKTTSICFCLSLSVLIVISLNGNENKYYPDKLACPVTANLFPEQIKSGHLVRCIFSEKAIAHRLSISLIGAGGKDVEVRFRWIGAWDEFTRPQYHDFGIHYGSFIVKADGTPYCFFLGPNANIPGNIPFHEFDLQIPVEAQVKDFAFSSLLSEIATVTCPMPDLEKEISEAYKDYLLSPKDKAKIFNLIQLLDKTVPTYDCRRDIDSRPIPAWWMADDKNIDKWLAFIVEQVRDNNDSALKLFTKFYATSDGYISEALSYRMLEILLDQPTLVLDNWADIRDYKEKISNANRFQSPESTIRMINIYREIATRDLKRKSACEEIIEVLIKN